MKNIYDQTALAPVSVSIRGGSTPPDFETSPPTPGYNFRMIGGCNRPLF